MERDILIFTCLILSPGQVFLIWEHKEKEKFANEAQEMTLKTGNKIAFLGVKGDSWALYLPKFDVVNGVGIDHLHNTLLGVIKMLIQIWYIGKNLKAIDDKIQNLWLANIISRVPRIIEYQLGACKGKEFRLLLLLCFVPILFPYLPQNYLQHYVLLVESRFLLLQYSISYEEFVKAFRKLKYFCIRIHSLYGKRYYMYNIQNLLHLAYNVRQLDQYGCSQHFGMKVTMVIRKTCSTVAKE